MPRTGNPAGRPPKPIDPAKLHKKRMVAVRFHGDDYNRLLAIVQTIRPKVTIGQFVEKATMRIVVAAERASADAGGSTRT